MNTKRRIMSLCWLLVVALILPLSAAGNAGPKSPPLFPGADPYVIAVTATDVDDKLFTGANRGKYISVAAPGVDILVPAPRPLVEGRLLLQRRGRQEREGHFAGRAEALPPHRFDRHQNRIQRPTRLKVQVGHRRASLTACRRRSALGHERHVARFVFEVGQQVGALGRAHRVAL